MIVAADQVVVDHAGPGGAVRALDHVSIALARGDTVALMGAAGAGKSTLVAALAGLHPPSAGRVLHAGRIALALQRPERALFAETVRADVSFAARMAGASPAACADVAHHALDAVGLHPAAFLDRDPLQLSGGEQRRVAIAGVLASRPDAVLLDEPFAGLDLVAREALAQTIRALAASGVGVLVVTHDAEQAAACCDRLVVLERGRIAWDGDLAPVLGDPARAAALGLPVPAGVDIVHAVARARGASAPHSVEPELLARVLAHVAQHPARAQARLTRDPAETHEEAPQLLPVARSRTTDALARLVAFLVLAAGLVLAPTVAGAAVLACAAVAGLVVARTPVRVVMLALRPLLLLVVTLVAVQLLVGGAPTVGLVGGRTSDADLAFAVLRSLQAVAIVLAAVALTTSTPALELANGIRTVLRPLRVVRAPVDELALVLALGIGMVPAMAADQRDLERAQVARGVPRPHGLGARMEVRAALLVPLVVLAFRRASQVADALLARGIRPGAPHVSLHPRTLGMREALLVGSAIAAVAVARMV